MGMKSNLQWLADHMSDDGRVYFSTERTGYVLLIQDGFRFYCFTDGECQVDWDSPEQLIEGNTGPDMKEALLRLREVLHAKAEKYLNAEGAVDKIRDQSKARELGLT